MSMARDGSGTGVSSAYLLVDGIKIILRDDTKDLLDEDGKFTVTVEVEVEAKKVQYTLSSFTLLIPSR